jgi:UDP-N-acetylglucosamine 1-carboxyvinyltransferase
MSKFIIKGSQKLEGEINLLGNKNSALKILPATLLADSCSTITNIPPIRDVKVMISLIEKLGAKVKIENENAVTVDPSTLSSYVIDPDLSTRIRASVVLAAPLLVKFGKAVITPPGGDQIGERLLETHFTMLENLGVEIKRENGKYFLNWVKKGKNDIFLEEASVTATEMAVMMTVSQLAEIKIQDAASEPHVKDLADFLGKMGASISGVGTNTLLVKGSKKLKGTEHKIIPDYIEGGTFAIAAAITGGKVTIRDYRKDHYLMILSYLKNMGVSYFENKQELKILPSDLVAKKRKFQTRPWPGFPTDLMSPFIVLATQTKGTVLCHDWMYEWRMFFVDDLISMGANIFIADPHRVVVSGPTKLMADFLYCKDIRAGISVILAALAAQGESVVDNIEMVERGYAHLEERLRGLGAKLKRINLNDKNT